MGVRRGGERVRPPRDARGTDGLVREDAVARHVVLRREGDRRSDGGAQQRRVESGVVPRQRAPELRAVERDDRRDRGDSGHGERPVGRAHAGRHPGDGRVHLLVHVGHRTPLREPAQVGRETEHPAGERVERRPAGEDRGNGVVRDRPGGRRLLPVLPGHVVDPPTQLRLPAGDGVVRGCRVRHHVHRRRVLARHRGRARPVDRHVVGRRVRHVPLSHPAVHHAAGGGVEHRGPVREREGVLRARVRVAGRASPDRRPKRPDGTLRHRRTDRVRRRLVRLRGRRPRRARP